MKKKYVNPQMNLIAFEITDVICTSPKETMNYGGVCQGVGKAEGQSRGSSIWDDEE